VPYLVSLTRDSEPFFPLYVDPTLHPSFQIDSGTNPSAHDTV
jgi:hypothetical protein